MTKNRCSCGADNPEDAKYSTSCGLNITKTRCSCGADNSEDAKFCANCGLNLSQQQSQRQDIAAGDRPPKRGIIRWDNWVLWFPVGFVILVILIALAAAAEPPTDETSGPQTPNASPTERVATTDYMSRPTPTPAFSEHITAIEKNTLELLGPFLEEAGFDEYECEHKPGKSLSGITAARFCDASNDSGDMIAILTVQFDSGLIHTNVKNYDSVNNRVVQCVYFTNTAEEDCITHYVDESEALEMFLALYLVYQDQ